MSFLPNIQPLAVIWEGMQTGQLLRIDVGANMNCQTLLLTKTFAGHDPVGNFFVDAIFPIEEFFAEFVFNSDGMLCQ